jgi:hypothetical protein
MYYFAYGSELDRQHMRSICPAAKPHLSADLPHYRLVFSGWSRQWRGSTASLQASSGDRVKGGLYEISEQDLARLDKNAGAPAAGTRLNVRVFPDTGPAVDAVTHVNVRGAEAGKPSAEYMALIKQGYHQWGLV